MYKICIWSVHTHTTMYTGLIRSVWFHTRTVCKFRMQPYVTVCVHTALVCWHTPIVYGFCMPRMETPTYSHCMLANTICMCHVCDFMLAYTSVYGFCMPRMELYTRAYSHSMRVLYATVCCIHQLYVLPVAPAHMNVRMRTVCWRTFRLYVPYTICLNRMASICRT